MVSCLQPDFTLLYAANEEQGRSVCLSAFKHGTVCHFMLFGRVCVAFKVIIIAAECDVMFPRLFYLFYLSELQK